jgi:diketogulonate reductase-like aldo/keto reductase
MKKQIRLADGRYIPALGMGSWHLAQGRHPISQELAALKRGLELNMSLIDTAEVYGNGESEILVGKAIARQRDDVFLVSKIAPNNAGNLESIKNACIQSLSRLGTDYLDLYLLHWRAGIRQLDLLVESFEQLKREGLIRAWGVSNFGVRDMEELLETPNGHACAINQISYSLFDRAAEHRLIPWSQQHGIPVMAYSPLGSSSQFTEESVLERIAQKYAVAPSAIAINWSMRNGMTTAIPESGTPAHIEENARALTIELDEQDLALLNRSYPLLS